MSSRDLLLRITLLEIEISLDFSFILDETAQWPPHWRAQPKSSLSPFPFLFHLLLYAAAWITNLNPPSAHHHRTQSIIFDEDEKAREGMKEMNINGTSLDGSRHKNGKCWWEMCEGGKRTWDEFFSRFMRLPTEEGEENFSADFFLFSMRGDWTLLNISSSCRSYLCRWTRSRMEQVLSAKRLPVSLERLAHVANYHKEIKPRI